MPQKPPPKGKPQAEANARADIARAFERTLVMTPPDIQVRLAIAQALIQTSSKLGLEQGKIPQHGEAIFQWVWHGRTPPT